MSKFKNMMLYMGIGAGITYAFMSKKNQQSSIVDDLMNNNCSSKCNTQSNKFKNMLKKMC